MFPGYDTLRLIADVEAAARSNRVSPGLERRMFQWENVFILPM